jgi:phage gpG-like protein
MSRAGAAAEDMKEVMHSLGMIVVHAARPPTRSGALAGTIRASKTKTKAVVRAGYASVPYAGVIHYGWPARNIPANPFLDQARAEQMPRILREFEAALIDILDKEKLT